MNPTTKADNLAAALAAFQADLPHIGKGNTANTGTYSYRYADLATIHATVLPLLAKHGLAWTTKPTVDESGRFVLAYKLAHTSGDAEEGVYPLGNLGPAQAMGSAITYARRYCICAVTGVAPDEDDDGAAATAHARNQPTAEEIAAAEKADREAWEAAVVEIDACATDDQLRELWRRYAASGALTLRYTDGTTLADRLTARKDELAVAAQPADGACESCDGTGKVEDLFCGPCNGSGRVKP